MRQLASLALLTTVLVACGDSAGPADEEHEWIEPSWPELRSDEAHDEDPLLDADEELAFARDHRLLALDLYHQTRQASSWSGKNLMLSPYSLRSALAMVYGGSVGLAHTQIRDVMHFSLEGERQHVAFNWLDDQLRARAQPQIMTNGEVTDEVIVAPVNAAWVEGSIADDIAQPFIDQLAVHYDAGLYLADFNNQLETERARINQWVEARTRGLIPDLLPDLPPVTTMVMVNALHLKAPWAEAFDRKQTRSGSFTRLDGSTVNVDLMSSGTGLSVGYAEDIDYLALALPLRGAELEVVIVMPLGDFASFEDALDEPRLAEILAGLEGSFWAVQMPRVSVASTFALKPELEELGMIEPFDPQEPVEPFADIGPVGKLWEVHHQVNVALDEGGVEAAAATAAVFEEEGGAEFEQVVIDRPFFLMIRDRPSDTLLFFGRVLDPNVG
ncbi:MAG: serpin family protein [Enhygromyxa sp.]